MNFKPGQRINIKPVIFYPKGAKVSKLWTLRWETYHQAAREKYRSLLKNRDTFELSSLTSYHGKYTAKEYRSFCFSFDGFKHDSELDEGEKCSRGVETITAELLLNHPEINSYNRYSLPYCLSVLMIDEDKEWVDGGGRNFNGDLNLGGGILVIPQWKFDDDALMSTLMHELGHAFGLPHCWQRPVENELLKSCYYGEKTSKSIMSYNKDNWTNETEIDKIPGCFLGDDIDALSQNKWVFPNLHFDKNSDFDCPPTSDKCPSHNKETHPLHLGPIHMFFCTTEHKSNFGNITFILNDHPSRWILSNHKAIGFDHEHMWHSPEVNAMGWVSFDVTFAVPIAMNRIIFYTEYGGKMHRAERIQIEAQKTPKGFTFIKQVATTTDDTEVIFNVTTASIWRFAFKAGTSKHVVVRGMRFFANDREFYPPLGPYATTDFGQTQGSKVSNLVEIQRVISPNGGVDQFNPTTMWMSDKVNKSGWVSMEIVFPTEVQLDQLVVYQFSFNKPKQIQLEVSDSTGEYQFVKRSSLSGVKKNFTFSKRKGKAWKIAFEGDKDGFIIIRGLRFLIGNEEFYPPSRIHD